jgi:GNAT superfamily N-acetyltransferase
MSAGERAMLSFEVVDAAAAGDPRLRDELLRTWVQVTDAGGAVGFVPPADETAVGRTLDEALARVSDGRDALGVLRLGERAVGMGLLVSETSPLRSHWRTVLRVMVAPELQGIGAGRLLLEGLHDLARGLGLERLVLTVRGGTGTERFYERFGYRMVGRHPGAIRIGPGDDRDELQLMVHLLPDQCHHAVSVPEHLRQDDS